MIFDWVARRKQDARDRVLFFLVVCDMEQTPTMLAHNTGMGHGRVLVALSYLEKHGYVTSRWVNSAHVDPHGVPLRRRWYRRVNK